MQTGSGDSLCTITNKTSRHNYCKLQTNPKKINTLLHVRSGRHPYQLVTDRCARSECRTARLEGVREWMDSRTQGSVNTYSSSRYYCHRLKMMQTIGITSVAAKVRPIKIVDSIRQVCSWTASDERPTEGHQRAAVLRKRGPANRPGRHECLCS